jgi:PAS domain S-box-containing protein
LESGSLTLFEITAPEYRDLDRHALEEMKATGTHQPFEKEYIRKDGSRVPVLVGSAYLGGPEEMAVGFLLELTESKRAEKERRESEERYRSLFESNPLPLYVYDVQTLRFLAVNEAAIHHYGYSRAEFLSRSLLDIRPPEEIPALLNAVSKRTPGIDIAGEFKHQKKDGSLIDVEITSHPMAFDGHEAELVLANDITERKHAETALHEADQRAIVEYEKLLERISGLSQALGTARDLLTIFRALRDFAKLSVPSDGLFVSLCDPVREVRTACYGWGDGQEIDISALPPMPITAEGLNSRAVRTGQVIITDDYMKAKRGHPIVIAGPDNGLRPQSSLAAPMAVMGRIIGTIETQSYEPAAYKEGHATAMRMAANLTAVAIENVRLLERESSARASAEESNRLKDEFLATVSHELRTPLTAILGWSRMLETGGLDPAVAARAIETIRRNARAQSQIIDDILDVSRIITGNLYLDLQPIELAPVIEASINVVRPTAEAKGIQIETEFDSQPTVVSGDSNRLQQVFWNLLSNAIKFTPTGGWVRIAVHQLESCVEIKVADNGQGIGADFLPFVFDRFRQADSTTTRQHGGLGLGLAIARQLVEIHGGSVGAESAGEQKGATFTLQLPVVGSVSSRTRDDAAARESEKIVPELVPALAGVSVLLVDDDSDTLAMITEALAKRKAKVTSVLSAAEAIASIKESRPDVIVSDIAMPGEDGYDLLKKVRALDSDQAALIPAIAITAYAREEDRQRALSAGYQDYLTKPVELSELITIVSKLAGRNETSGNGKVK